jgi:hypothetical protein
MQVRSADPSSWISKAWETTFQSLLYPDKVPWRSKTRAPSKRFSLGIHSTTRWRSTSRGVADASVESSGFTTHPIPWLGASRPSLQTRALRCITSPERKPRPRGVGQKREWEAALRCSGSRGTKRAVGLNRKVETRHAPLSISPNGRGWAVLPGCRKVNCGLKVR